MNINSTPLAKMIGKDAIEGEVPWMVYFYWLYDNGTFKETYDCSGVIIADQWMLTAAHCLKKELV